MRAWSEALAVGALVVAFLACVVGFAYTGTAIAMASMTISGVPALFLEVASVGVFIVGWKVCSRLGRHLHRRLMRL